jgi:hypothetical protein
LKNAGGSNLKRFKFYSLYAWLGSLIMTILMILASTVLNKSHPFFLDIGTYNCFVDEVISDKGKNYKINHLHKSNSFKIAAKLAFYYGPLLVLLLPNIIFFIVTFLKIMQTQNMLNDALRIGSSNAERHRNKRK